MKNKEIMDSLIKEIDETKQKPFSREKVVILSRNEKIAIDNKILCLQEENAKLKKVIDILKNKFKYELGVSVVNEKYHYSLEFLFNYSYMPITKEQYDLLKEYLGYVKD